MSPILIPYRLFQRGASLDSLGLEEQAWRPTDAMEIVGLLRDSPVAVLGGDVYFKTSAGFEHAYENWYCEAERGEVSYVFASRSRQDSLAYIERLLDSESGEKWVSLVLSEPLLASEPDESDEYENR